MAGGQLRALASLPEVLNSIPSTHVASNSVSGDTTLLRAFKGIRHIHDTQTYMQAKHSHTKIKSFFKQRDGGPALYYKEAVRWSHPQIRKGAYARLEP